MTQKQYNFQKNIRIVVIVIGLAWLVFGAGAVFTGYKPTVTNYIMLGVVLVSLINAIFNKPTSPQEPPQSQI